MLAPMAALAGKAMLDAEWRQEAMRQPSTAQKSSMPLWERFRTSLPIPARPTMENHATEERLSSRR
jgi:hypothetical protein